MSAPLRSSRPFGLDLNKWLIAKDHPKAMGKWVVLPPHRADMPKMQMVLFDTGADALAAFESGGTE